MLVRLLTLSPIAAGKTVGDFRATHPYWMSAIPRLDQFAAKGIAETLHRDSRHYVAPIWWGCIKRRPMIACMRA